MSVCCVEDIFVGWRCLRQLQERLRHRTLPLGDMGPEEFLDFPKGSAATHQFLERYRVLGEISHQIAKCEPHLQLLYPGAIGQYLGRHQSAGYKPIARLDAETRTILEQMYSPTAERLPAGCGVINGLIQQGEMFAAVDVLRISAQGTMRLSVVRSASKMKDSYVRELAWAGQLLESAGYGIDEYSVLLLNKEYRLGDEQCFVELRQKRRQKFLRTSMIEEAANAERRLNNGEPAPCGKSNCPLCPQTGKDDANTIIYLHKSSGLASKIMRQGVTKLEELDRLEPPLKKKLTPQHWVQHRAAVENKEQIQASRLHRFFDSLQWPLSFIDFECFLEALPPWEHAGVWEHLPFLFSIYAMDEKLHVSKTGHYLNRGGDDERYQMAVEMISHLSGTGSILVYGMHLERAILGRLAQALPELAGEIGDITRRLVDLQVPFAEFWYYHPGQKGKIRLKTILPLLTSHEYVPEKVSSGSQAFVGYYYLRHSELPVPPGWDPYAAQVRCNPEEFYRQVTSYCDTDTYGLAYLLKSLVEKTLAVPKEAG